MQRSVRLIFILILPLTLRAQLQWPAITEQTKPWTRWWWMGSAVNPPDLTANLQEYHDAGLGGLELTPIYGVKGYERQFVDYLSPKWMDLFSFTLQETKRLGLGLDMSTGTGWPFGGGPLIDSAYACRELFVTTWTLPGGGALPDSMTIGYRQEAYVHTDGRATTIDQLKEPVFTNDDLQALALFQVRFPDPAPLQTLMAYSSTGTILDITDKVDATGHLRWTAPAGGTWTLYGLFLGWHGKMVERAAPGAEGNVIDHFSAKALRKYLSRFDTAFTGHNLSPLRSFFNDSYEVDDSRGQSNWTAGFLAAFRRLRGYDLRQHLPALFGRDTKENNSRVLCDYRETISDLLLEQFTQPWHDWAHSKGALIRNQAHGSPANILDLYAASDIPETEGQDILRYKFATSAAHVTGKRLASAETVTWLDEHFLSTYSDVKKALDGFFLGGVNHVFYHGTAYTPVNDPFPGWLFYASVHFTPNDPSWPDFPTLNRYVSRVQSFLQQGSPDNDVLLYFPIYDSWSEPGNALLKHYDRMDPEFTNTGFKECAEYLQSHGYGFDYISDKQLQQTLPPQYKTILIPACQYMPAPTIQKLISLQKQGINILVYKHSPTSAPGLNPPTYPHFSFPVSADLSSLLKNTARETLVDDSLACIRRNYGNGKVYFIVNKSLKPFSGFVPLNTNFTAAGIFDPMTGEKGLAKTNDHSVYLQLRPGETCLVETNVAPRGPLFAYYSPSGSSISIAVPHHEPFVDSMKYTLAFDRPTADAAAWLLDLGKVVRNAEVSLNGQPLATLIGPEYRITIPAERLKARNTLAITVRGGMVNHIIEMDRRHIPWKKFYNTNFPAHDRANRGADGLFDASKWTPIEEGLLGPITLTPLKNSDLDWITKVGARSAPPITTITEVKGADNTGQTLSTQSIQSTIDRVAANGGGTVTFAPGKYLTGSIFIKAGVTLNIAKDVELIGSENFADYPEIDTRIAGIEMRWPAALINIIGVKKAALTGEGVVNARGKFCWDKYWNMRKTYDPKGLRWIVDYDAKRVRTLLVQNSEDITIKGLKFIDAGFWTVQLLYSKYVTVDGIVVRNNENGHGPSTDGVDIDSSTWVLVQNCDIDCNDDDFCLKAGRDWDGLRVNRPTEYVVIRHCTARKGGGLLTIGSETSGGIRHVLATDLTAKGTGNGFHIKSATTRGGTVEDIHVRNIHMDSVGNAILFTMNWNPAYSYSTLPPGYNPDSIPTHWKTMLHKVEPAEKGTPHFRDIEISNIVVGSAKKAISATGLEQSLITGVHIDTGSINAVTAGEISFAKDWKIEKLDIHTKDGSTLQIKNTEL
ncbi:MAG TPA: glycosyl hydrolase [Puia sp.]|uniref:glycosyl hydrolase n=1 Tax=Puia sp. TaxID=2045100 RepID=UPI002BBA5F3F|nr:glycosyl hydrolase [Puia sp.]HVU93965.1 glycosyl hydrolase [Puia sp.]